MKRYPALYLISFALSAVTSLTAFGQQDSLYQRPTLEVGKITNKIKLDGVLDEPEWRQASVIERLTMVEPQQGAAPTLQTRVQVLADKDFLVFGVYCEETSPQGIVSISKVRDANLSNQDYIRLVLDPFQDGRSGFIFSVNPAGARYDALVTNQGESEDKNWDAVWDARTYRDSAGWSIEIMIPAQSLSFKRGLHEWWFNIERRVQRLLEVDRWSNPSRDQWVYSDEPGRRVNSFAGFRPRHRVERPSGTYFQRSDCATRCKSQLQTQTHCGYYPAARFECGYHADL
jgi:hypothetical protein